MINSDLAYLSCISVPAELFSSSAETGEPQCCVEPVCNKVQTNAANLQASASLRPHKELDNEPCSSNGVTERMILSSLDINVFAFPNASYPGDPDTHVIPYPAPISQNKSALEKKIISAHITRRSGSTNDRAGRTVKHR